MLQVSNIAKRWGAVAALSGVSFEAARGEFLALVGPSGCGKSTLLNIIAGLETQSAGEVRIDNRPVDDLPPAARDIAMVFQSYALYPNMTVLGNIAFGLEMRGVPRPERERAAREVAELLQISPLLERKPAQLSGGQRQRVAMGRALVRRPKVFLFDEPLSNLDAKLRVDMRTEIKRLRSNLDAAAVYVTHDQVEAMTLADRIAVMRGGEILQLGTPDEIYGRPNNIFVAAFMGSPAMNFIPANVVRQNENDEAQIQIPGPDGPQVLRMPPEVAGPAPSGPALLGLRPEHLTAPAPDGAQTLRVRADLVEPAGADTYVIADLGGKPVTARLPAGFRIQPGEVADLACDIRRAPLFNPETELRIN